MIKNTNKKEKENFNKELQSVITVINKISL